MAQSPQFESLFEEHLSVWTQTRYYWITKINFNKKNSSKWALTAIENGSNWMHLVRVIFTTCLCVGWWAWFSKVQSPRWLTKIKVIGLKWRAIFTFYVSKHVGLSVPCHADVKCFLNDFLVYVAKNMSQTANKLFQLFKKYFFFLSKIECKNPCASPHNYQSNNSTLTSEYIHRIIELRRWLHKTKVNNPI